MSGIELLKQPVTEREYFDVIEGLGAMIHSTNRGIIKGHIKDSLGASSEVAEMAALQRRMADELETKFGVLHVSKTPTKNADGTYPPPPEGKQWYWSWYKQMKEQWLREEYEGEICSVCPFSSGFSASFTNRVPCTAIQGYMSRLMRADMCGMVSFNYWSQEVLIEKIRANGGDEAVEKFEKKRTEIAARLNAKTTA